MAKRRGFVTEIVPGPDPGDPRGGAVYRLEIPLDWFHVRQNAEIDEDRLASICRQRQASIVEIAKEAWDEAGPGLNDLLYELLTSPAEPDPMRRAEDLLESSGFAVVLTEQGVEYAEAQGLRALLEAVYHRGVFDYIREIGIPEEDPLEPVDLLPLDPKDCSGEEWKEDFDPGDAGEERKGEE